MPSPFFPHMDPYLEAMELWPDFHSKFINCWQETILAALPPNYDARLEERIYLIERPTDARLIRPDVAVVQTDMATVAAGESSAVATLEPVTIPLFTTEEVKETSMRILHRPDQEVVTVLEFLSPANKSASGQAVYLQKRTALVTQEVHLVELDLLLGGERLPMSCPLPDGHYYALVSRSNRRPNCDVYAWTIRDPLPTIPIPLKEPDPDIAVNLAEVFATAYQRGQYERAIDYAAEIEAELDADDLQWAADHAAGS